MSKQKDTEKKIPKFDATYKPQECAELMRAPKGKVTAKKEIDSHKILKGK